MKTQIIALDQQEDYLSVRDKLNWSQTGRVMLTWPSEQPILTRLDLVLIQRHAAARGVQIALVTGNSEIRAMAEELRMPVFESTKAAQAARWRVAARSGAARRGRSRRRAQRLSLAELQALRESARASRPRWEEHPFVRWLGFGLAVAALLALLFYILPSASLSLSPETQEQSLSLEVRANPSITQVNLAGRLPTYPTSVIVEARDSQPATGSVPVPFKTATGGIQFTNLTEEAVGVPAGTVVSTLDSPAVRFATTSSGQVPAGVGRTLILNANAMMPGAAGNLPAESLVAVEGQLGLKLNATNQYPTHGGADDAVKGPSEADRQALLENVTAALQESAREEMQAILPQGDLALAASLTPLRTLEESYTPEVGQPGETLELTLRLEFGAQAVAFADLQALVTPPLDASLPQGFIPQPETLSIRLSSTPEMIQSGEFLFSITAERRLQAEILAGRVVALILGKNSDQASQYLLQTLPLAAAPHIQIRPDWWPRLPVASFRIQVQTGEAP